MKGWISQLAGVLLVLLFAGLVGGFILVLRSQQSVLGASLAAAHIRALTPRDGATNVPLSGNLLIEYSSRPTQDPAIKFEPSVGVQLSPGAWQGTTYLLPYRGLRDSSIYHVELDQDDGTSKGEHKQIKVRWSFRTGRGAQLTPTPTAASSASVAPTAAKPQLIWYGFGESNLSAKDWSGQPQGSIALQVASQSPDGSKLFPPDPSHRIVDSAGNVLGILPPGPYIWWQDDSSGFCELGGNSRGDQLELVTASGKATVIADVAAPTSPPQVPMLAACSALNHQAIVYDYGYGHIYGFSLISLIDGHVIYHQRYPNPMANLTASRDGRYVAEQAVTTSGITWIRELPSGRIVAQVNLYVRGFSWDGSLIAGDTAGYAGNGEAQLVEWQTGRMVWRMADNSFPYVLARPFGSEVALAVWAPGSRTAAIYVIRPDGHATVIASGTSPMQPF